MKELLKKLLRSLAYFAAAIVIVLAIAVGIFRLMLPRLPEYQEEIKAWASSAIGMGVEFSGMNARWRLSGPELSFYGARLSHADTGISVLAAEEVSIGVGLLRLIADRELVVDRVSVRNSSVEVRQDGNGNWMLQDIPIDELIPRREIPLGEFELVGQNLKVAYEHPSSGQLVPFTVRAVTVTSGREELDIDADIDLPGELGRRLKVSANKRLRNPRDEVWHLYAEGDSVELAGWSRMARAPLPEIRSGLANFVLWIDWGVNGIDSATANLVVTDLDADDDERTEPFAIRGSFEYSADPDGWLLGANQLRITTAAGDWPQTSLQLNVQKDPKTSELGGLRVSATYFNLDDLRYLQAWLPAERGAQLAGYAPTGVMRNVEIELSDLQAETPGFDVSAELEAVGCLAVDGQPGLQNFSGSLRADRDGGRVEIRSNDLVVDLGAQLPQPLELDDAYGTVIWRRGPAGMTVLSDSIQVRNTDFDSQMSLQVSIPADNSSPVLDYQSTWSVFDIGAVKRYLPVRLITPKLYQWLSDSLVSGYARSGTTRFSGALDRFPFDNDDGIFRIEARLEDTVIRFAPDWPAPEFRHLDLVVDKTRLFSIENSAVNVGNFVEDAKIEIPDLRQPVLGIKAFATGSLQSIRDYVAQSPISAVFGGHLDRVEVDGDASFDLDISLPIQNTTAYEFTTRIRANDGTVRVVGFPAPVTELDGTVTVTRDKISSESLVGRFLGNPIEMSLSRIDDPEGPYSVMLEGNGHTTTGEIQAQLGVPLKGVLSGDADYQATIRFPNGRAAKPGPLQIVVQSDLFGIQSDLPEPLFKQEEVALLLRMSLEFPTPDEIYTAGSLAGDINWTARFLRQADAWDFDRGVLALGEYPREAEVRGLHIHGQVDTLRLHEWLAEGRRGSQRSGIAERIRSIDLGVGKLYAAGQQYMGHHLVVDRSGRDWVIQLTGDQAQGQITVPYDFMAGRPMTLQMERLVLPGDETVDGERDTGQLDPRVLPAISIRADEFALGNRAFGKLEASFERSARGLESTNLTTTDDSFTVTGNAGWIVDPEEESGQRTYLDVTLASSNVQQTSRRLDYDPGINSDAMEIKLDIGWPGGPRKDFMSVLNGKVSVRLGDGQLAEVEPGAGRMFGLMSFTALPRRLALDFSDVFDKGFGFDGITGDFRLVSGDAYTCNLTLTGPAADVGIVGRTGLMERDYDQAAIVSANVGSALPVVGLFAGGPQVAAALLVFSQIFRKPLKDMGQVFYTVAGSWDDPAIDTADSQSFAAVSGRAGCIEAE